MSKNTDLESVSAALWKPLRIYKELLNVVENPSVGTLAASSEVCRLLSDVLSLMLYSALEQASNSVRVMCTIGCRETLALKIATASNGISTLVQHRLDDLSQHVRQLRGDVCIYEDQSGGYTCLTIPLTP
jgi:hypothetical protein